VLSDPTFSSDKVHAPSHRSSTAASPPVSSSRPPAAAQRRRDSSEGNTTLHYFSERQAGPGRRFIPSTFEPEATKIFAFTDSHERYKGEHLAFSIFDCDRSSLIVSNGDLVGSKRMGEASYPVLQTEFMHEHTISALGNYELYLMPKFFEAAHMPGPPKIAVQKIKNSKPLTVTKACNHMGMGYTSEPPNIVEKKMKNNECFTDKKACNHSGFGYVGYDPIWVNSDLPFNYGTPLGRWTANHVCRFAVKGGVLFLGTLEPGSCFKDNSGRILCQDGTYCSCKLSEVLDYGEYDFRRNWAQIQQRRADIFVESVALALEKNPGVKKVVVMSHEGFYDAKAFLGSVAGRIAPLLGNRACWVILGHSHKGKTQPDKCSFIGQCGSFRGFRTVIPEPFVNDFAVVDLSNTKAIVPYHDTKTKLEKEHQQRCRSSLQRFLK
jgi:predicted phosphodiesterase